MGRRATPDTITDLVELFRRVVDGVDPEELGYDGDGLRAAAQDVRAYYEEAGLALADHVPAARRIESWLYHDTLGGALVVEAARVLRERGADRATWYYLLPSTQR